MKSLVARVRYYSILFGLELITFEKYKSANQYQRITAFPGLLTSSYC